LHWTATVRYEVTSLKPKRIAYVQYTNPAGYPPLQQSSQILAENGWDVLFLGTGAWGVDKLRFKPNERIQVRQLRFQSPGWLQKAHYAYFHLWCLAWVIRWRPSWIYASDLLSASFAWFASAALRIPVVFHEHDSPAQETAGVFARFCFRMRIRCARRAALCVLPNRRRADAFAGTTRCSIPPLVVWNCPRCQEVAPARERCEEGRLRLLYHGSIVPERLPVAVIEALAALPEGVSLTVVGYETVGSRGYLSVLLSRAAELGISGRLETLGALSRDELMQVCGRHDAGLSLMPLRSEDPNLGSMTGASNKPFDYLACGLAVLVSRLPDWEEMFVRPGYGLSCDPSSQQSIAAAVGRLCANPEQTRAMGERGRQRILKDWNYERQFQPVLDLLNGVSSCNAGTMPAAEAGSRQVIAK
jgi:glycosyltransferase involved in cell wall biosynthesis